MSNSNDGPEKAGLAAQAESVRRDYPVVAAVLTGFANEIGALQARVFKLEKLLEMYLEASRPTA
jgi:hypothetical protein